MQVSTAMGPGPASPEPGCRHQRCPGSVSPSECSRIPICPSTPPSLCLWGHLFLVHEDIQKHTGLGTDALRGLSWWKCPPGPSAGKERTPCSLALKLNAPSQRFRRKQHSEAKPCPAAVWDNLYFQNSAIRQGHSTVTRLCPWKCCK